MEINLQSNIKIGGYGVNCQLTLNLGEITLLQGPNGIGKTSLIHLLKLKQNEVFAKRKLVFVDQLPLQPLNEISFQNVLETLSCCRLEENILFKNLADKAAPFLQTPIKKLSGGQNQLVKIGLGLFISGDIFILDEPFQFLDQENVKFLKNVLKSLKEQNKAVLVVEHRNDLIEDIIDKKFEIYLNENELRVKNGN